MPTSDADLALLKIDDKTVQFPYFDLSYVSPDLLGETVVAMGSPAGYQSSASHGILSAKGRMFTAENHTYKNLLQTDAAINPGNSGGPLVDLNGSLVGINSAKLAGPAIENIGFAIPHDIVVPWGDGCDGGRARVEAHRRDSRRLAAGRDAATARAGTQDLDRIEGGGNGFRWGRAAGDGRGGEQPRGGRQPAQGAMIVVAIGSYSVTDENSLPPELKDLQTGDDVRLQLVYMQRFGGFLIQRGESVELTAR